MDLFAGNPLTSWELLIVVNARLDALREKLDYCRDCYRVNGGFIDDAAEINRLSKVLLSICTLLHDARMLYEGQEQDE